VVPLTLIIRGDYFQGGYFNTLQPSTALVGNVLLLVVSCDKFREYSTNETLDCEDVNEPSLRARSSSNYT
jgi:hypothetical protein